MISKWVRTGKRYRGVGGVRQAEQVLAKVTYDLFEEQEYFTIEEMGSREPLTEKGEMRLRGMITVVKGEEHLDRYGSFALHLSDGRVKQAMIKSRPQWDSPKYHVVAYETE